MLKKITIETASRFCALVIGPAGIGKTSLLRTILGQCYDQESGWVQCQEPNGKVLTLSAESGLLCVRDCIAGGLVEGFEIGSFSDMREAFTALQSPAFKERYQWVFIDSLTEIAARCVESAKQKFPSGGDSYKLWGEYNDSMTALIKSFRDLADYNVVFTCLETISQDQNNVRYKAPMISGTGLKERLTSYFDEVLYMERERNEDGSETVVFKTRELGVAKDRSGRLEPIEPANLLTIRNKIIGE